MDMEKILMILMLLGSSETTTLRPTTSDVTQVCTTVNKADIVFLVDGSGSIGDNNFQKVRQFLHSFIEGLDIGSDKVRVGLAQYSSQTYQEFLLKDHTDKKSLLQQVDSLPYRNGGTLTGMGLTFLQTQYFTKEAGSRADEQVPQIAVVMTDGASWDDVVGPSKLLRDQGVVVFAIGVGSYSEDQLKSMVNQPHEKSLFQIDNFQALQRVTEGLLHTVCNSVSSFVSGLAAYKKKQADLVMLIDQSSGIDPNDYTIMKTFVTDLVASFNVSKEFVRVGVAQFSSSPQKEFYLNEFYNETAVKNQILAMSQLGGDRNIGRALEFIQDYFQASRGSRRSQSISQNLVLITDGRSQDAVKEAAEKLQAQGIEVFAIGIHQHPDDLELLKITGSSDHFFTVQDFSSLANIKQKVVKTICDYIPDRPETTTLRPTTSDVTQVCTTVNKADIVFLVDGSRSIGDNNFQKVRQFLHSFIEGLDIGSDKVRVGLAQYNSQTYQEFLLKDHTDKTSLLQQVDSLPYRNGGTRTGMGLTFLQTQYFTKEAGSRAEEPVPQIAVVMTDGASQDDVVGPSKLLRDQGVVVFAIGVGSYSEDQLKSMVNQPHEKSLFQIDNFQALQRVTEGLLHTVCNSVSSFVSGLAAYKKKQADLVMLIDQSSGIDPNDYTIMKTFVTDLVASFNVSKEFVRVGVAQFSSSPQKEFYLNEFYNEMAVKNQILAMSQLGGDRNIGRALEFIQDYFQASRGSRKSQSISQNLVLITDGRSQDSVKEAAEKLQAQGIEVFAIGIHQHPDDLELLKITGSSDHFFTVQDFSSLANIKQKVVKTICDYIPDRPETTVHCTDSTMTVVLVKSDLIQLNGDKLRLKDFNNPACSLTMHSNHSHLVAVMSLNSCDTTLEEDEGNLILRNEITSLESSSCVNPKWSDLALGFKHKSPSAFTWKGYGVFSLPFEFFESEQFRHQKHASTYPVKVFLNQMIYMQIEANTSIPGTQLFVESCKATPYDNQNSHITYTIIEHGCVRDSTVKIYNGSKSQFRFGMKFIGAHEQVYISCSVMLCQTGVPGSRCSQGCISGNQRGKRQANANAQSDTHSISKGPLQLIRADDSQDFCLCLSLSMILVFMAGCVLVCGVVCGVVVYRSRRSRGFNVWSGGQPLQKVQNVPEGVQSQPPPTSD